MFELLPHLLAGARQGGELVESLRISRGTLKNAYERQQDRILRFGAARSTSYAARYIHAGLDTDEFPVFRIDETGKVQKAGKLITLEATESIWLPDERVLEGLPPEMHDVAPKGFLGRSFARRHTELKFPEDVSRWSDHHILIAISRRGEDLPGSLLVGRESFDRYQVLQHLPRQYDDFPGLASAALAGEHVGSSAGGEQPKFTALVNGTHRIVKFAIDGTDNARRWRDLLLLEHLALQTLRKAGISAAETNLVDVENVRCLVVDRFDRVGEFGRRSVMTLAAAADTVQGSWTDSAELLHRKEQLAAEHLERVALLDAYGALIANTDRHHYNLSLYPSNEGYRVAPAFDQLPMAYAPPASGNLRNEAIASPNPSVNTLDVWEQAQELARQFWQHADTQELSGSMSEIVTVHARR
ncbi:MAG: HipA domain-containing protein [Pseudomonadota bacterium]